MPTSGWQVTNFRTARMDALSVHTEKMGELRYCYNLATEFWLNLYFLSNYYLWLYCEYEIMSTIIRLSVCCLWNFIWHFTKKFSSLFSQFYFFSFQIRVCEYAWVWLYVSLFTFLLTELKLTSFSFPLPFHLRFSQETGTVTATCLTSFVVLFTQNSSDSIHSRGTVISLWGLGSTDRGLVRRCVPNMVFTIYATAECLEAMLMTVAINFHVNWLGKLDLWVIFSLKGKRSIFYDKQRKPNYRCGAQMNLRPNLVDATILNCSFQLVLSSL